MIYEFDDCVLDAATKQLSCAGEPVHVEPQVLAVLEYLVANHDRLVTKIELLDEVWGDRFVSESALTSRIKLARKACGDSGREQRIIKTVHSRGYRVIADVRVRRQRGTARRAAPTVAAGGGEGDAPGLVGRDPELDALEHQLATAMEGRRRAVFVTGETGAGKSALVAELLERLDDDTWMVLRGRCLRGRGVVEPYFCLLDALTDLSRSRPDVVTEVLERMAPSWLVQLPALVDSEMAERLERRLLGAPSQRMLREGADAFEGLAARCPTLLMIEDLQWADECTLDVLELLFQRTSPNPFLVVGTARTEPGPHQELIAGASTAGRGVELELGRLGLRDTGELIASRFGGATVPSELVAVVHDRCDGIPLFAQEIVTTLVRRGLVVEDDGSVMVAGSIDDCAAAVPESVRSLIERELAGLEPGERSVLETAGVAGLTFDGATVAAGLQRTVADTESVLSDLARRLGYVVADRGTAWPDGTVSTAFSFTHRLYRDVLEETTAPAVRATLHRRMGDALEAGHEGHVDEIASRLAEHFIHAGDTARSVVYLCHAGEQASSREAHGVALKLLTRALDATAELPAGDDRNRVELRVRIALGPALVATKGWIDPAVADNYEKALALCTEGEACPEEAAARYGLATTTELRGEFTRTEELLMPLLAAEAGGDLALEAHELVACSTFHQGAFGQSFENAGMVLDSWDEDAYSILMARIAEHPASSCNSWASLAAWGLGRFEESMSLAERAVELGEQNRYALTTALQQRAMLHQLRNEPEACAEWADRTREVGGEQDFPMRVVQGDIYRGWALSVTGSPEEGLGLIDGGLARFRAAGARLNEAYYLGLRAEALLNAGRPAEALEQLDEALATMDETTRSYFFESELHRLRAAAREQLGGDGWLEEARQALDDSLAVARRQGSPALELRAMADRVVLESAAGDPSAWRERLARLLDRFATESATDVTRARALLA